MIIRKASCLHNLNAVRHSRSVEKGIIIENRIPLGMQPPFLFLVAFLTECGFVCALVFYRAVIPTGFFKKQTVGHFVFYFRTQSSEIKRWLAITISSDF